MKKIITYSSLSLLIIATAYFLLSDNGSTFGFKSEEVAINNIEQISSIHISDSKNSIIINKKDELWTINNTHKANPNKVNELLVFLNKCTISKPIKGSLQKEVATKLKKQTLVNIYKDDKLLRSFYIGKYTAERIAILNNKDNKPFELSLLEWDNNPLIYFATSINDWQNKQLITDCNNIIGIELNDHTNRNKSYSLHLVGDTYQLKSPTTEKIINSYIVKQYTEQLKKIKIHKYATDINPTEKNAITKQKPIFELTIKYANRKEEIIGYHKTNNKLNTNNIDPDFLYILTNEGELAYAKYYDIYLIIDGLNILLGNH